MMNLTGVARYCDVSVFFFSRFIRHYRRLFGHSLFRGLSSRRAGDFFLYYLGDYVCSGIGVYDYSTAADGLAGVSGGAYFAGMEVA